MGWCFVFVFIILYCFFYCGKLESRSFNVCCVFICMMYIYVNFIIVNFMCCVYIDGMDCMINLLGVFVFGFIDWFVFDMRLIFDCLGEVVVVIVVFGYVLGLMLEILCQVFEFFYFGIVCLIDCLEKDGVVEWCKVEDGCVVVLYLMRKGSVLC